MSLWANKYNFTWDVYNDLDGDWGLKPVSGNDFQACFALIVYAFFIFKFDLFWLTVIRIYIYVHIIVGILLPLGIIPKVPHQGQAL